MGQREEMKWDAPTQCTQNEPMEIRQKRKCPSVLEEMTDDEKKRPTLVIFR